MSEVQNTGNETTEVAIPSNLDWNALVEQSMNVEKAKKGLTLTAEYIELTKVGDSFRGVYIGLGEVNVTDKQTGELKPLTAARFLISGKVFINAGIVLVDEINRAGVPVGTPMEVTYTEKKGNTKIYQLSLLTD